MEGKKKALIIRMLLFIVVIICLIRIAEPYYLSLRHKMQQEKLSDLLKIENQNQDTENAHNDASLSDADMRPKFEDLYAINSDLIGWLFIEGTEIDYPVVQCEDDEYYLSHDFYGEQNRYGCLFVRDYARINPPGTNIVIYGHSMKDGSMFGSLDKYISEKFYKKHPVINFSTLHEERTYEIVAAFESRVYEEDEEVFKYYQFYEADTEEEFLYFYDNIKKLSFYDTGVTAQFGDTFITLSTCSYHTDDGRFVVVGKLNEE